MTTVADKCLNIARDLAATEREIKTVTEEQVQPLQKRLSEIRRDTLKPLREGKSALLATLEKLGRENPAQQVMEVVDK